MSRCMAAFGFGTAVTLAWALSAGAAFAQSAQSPQAPTPVERAQGAAAQSGAPVTMYSSILVDQAGDRQDAATVTVNIEGLRLVEPSAAPQPARPGEGHLHYRVDRGPVIATSAAQLTFRELAAGSHVITVQLVGTDHRPLGPVQTLTAQMPGR